VFISANYYPIQCHSSWILKLSFGLYTLYTTQQSSLIHSHKLDHQLYAEDTTYTYIYPLNNLVKVLVIYMTGRPKLRLIVGTSKQRHFFPTKFLSQSITPSDTVRNLGITFDSDFNFRKHISPTCRSCRPSPYWRYISLSIANTIAMTLITSRLDYCISLLYIIASKDILKLQSVQNCLATIVTLLSTGSLFNLASFSNSALLPIKALHLENLHIYFPCFL